MRHETYFAFKAFLDRQAHLTEDFKTSILLGARVMMNDDEEFSRIDATAGVMRILNHFAVDNPMALDCIFNI